MARKLRIQYPGAIYHVTVRGIERRRIFNDAGDRERFVLRLSDAVDECGVRLYLFCLMNNHVHLLVETPQANLSAFMHKLQTAYTVYFNLRHGRSGHLMQGRFGAEAVEGDEYLLRLSRYIHLNPVFAEGARKQPAQTRRELLRMYPWSSYRGYAGLGRSFECVEEGPVLGMMSARPGRERSAYRRFVEAGIAESDTEFQRLLKESKWGIGGSLFQDRIHDLHADRVMEMRRAEDASFRRMSGTVPANIVVATVGHEFGIDPAAMRKRQYDCVARAVAVLLLVRHAGMNQRDAAAFLGMGSGSAACGQLKRLRERLGSDPALSERVKLMERAMGERTLV